MEKNVKKNESIKNILSTGKCIEILKECNMNIISLIYDDYCKIRYIETDKNRIYSCETIIFRICKWIQKSL